MASSNNTNASQYYTYASKSHLGVHIGHILRPNPNCRCIGAYILQFRILRQILQRETFESVDVQVARGLKLIGASSVQSFRFGLWPNVKAQVWSHSLWMLEYNIRSASIVGLVGAGGIGMELNKSMELASGFQKVTAILICILALSLCWTY